MATAVAAAAFGAAAHAQNGEDEAPPPTAAELYEQSLTGGDWVTNITLTIPEVAYSFEQNIDGKDDRESAYVSAWHGVHQSGDVATVLFAVSGMDVVFADNQTAEESATCRHLNDGRWWCDVEVPSFKIEAAFYLEHAPPVEEPEAPLRAPPR